MKPGVLGFLLLLATVVAAQPTKLDFGHIDSLRSGVLGKNGGL